MEDRELSFRRLDPASDKEIIKELFSSVFCAAPWYDDWSDPIQLDSYIKDLTGQDRSLSYGLFEADEMIGLALGNIRHWYSGTEYMIDEFCIRTDRQGRGLGSYFMKKIENDLRTMDLHCIYLQTERDFPAFDFYKKNGFSEVEETVALYKTF